MTRPIEHIAVAGNGIAALTVAAALARSMPAVRVFVVPTAGGRGIGDLYASAPPDRAAVYDAIGIDDRDLLTSGRGVFRLGFSFQGWRRDRSSFGVGLGGLGGGVGGIAFHALWIRLAQGGARLDPIDGKRLPPIAEWSAAAMLCDAARFAPPSEDPLHPFGELQVAIAVEPDELRSLLRAAAAVAGVLTTAGLVGVEADGNRIAALRLVDGSRCQADLYVDASGPDALLLHQLPGGGDREDWSRWLTADGAVVDSVGADANLPPVDTISAEPDGWKLVIPFLERTATIHLRDSRHSRVGLHPEDVALAQGRRRRCWIGNCVAIGDAAVEMEPLLAPHLRLVHTAVERLIRLMPGADTAEIETSQYEREWRQECDHMRDLLALAHAVRGWRDPAKMQKSALPTSASAILDLWLERGYLQTRDREFWPLDQQAQLLLGVGALPLSEDPQAGRTPERDVAAIARTRRRLIQAAVARAPRHADVIARFRR